MRPFFTYFGGKWRAAPKYPPPLHRQIIEPFAGSAGYALRYADRDVLLVEKSEPIAAIWSYLIGATEREILGLPLLEPGQSVEELPGLCQEARWLIAMWLYTGGQNQRRKRSSTRDLSKSWAPQSKTWGEPVRARIARQLRAIRHWKVMCGSYELAPDALATWFIDAPYESMGKHYPCSSRDIDFPSLAGWCRTRRGQVIVCEAVGATWLPFRAFAAVQSARPHTGRGTSAEALWLNDFPGAALWLPQEVA